jgi:hypothetical protein
VPEDACPQQAAQFHHTARPWDLNERHLPEAGCGIPTLQVVLYQRVIQAKLPRSHHQRVLPAGLLL